MCPHRNILYCVSKFNDSGLVVFMDRTQCALIWVPTPQNIFLDASYTIATFNSVIIGICDIVKDANTVQQYFVSHLHQALLDDSEWTERNLKDPKPEKIQLKIY